MGGFNFGYIASLIREVGIRKEYQTRIVTTANKANLDRAEAQDPMFEKTAYTMAGFF